jgi:hypothetical protein
MELNAAAVAEAVRRMMAALHREKDATLHLDEQIRSFAST